MKITDTHVYFWNGPFSNWHKQSFTHNGVQYNCSEQFMMEQKAWYFNDGEHARLIMEASSPGVQKALGRRVLGFDAVKWSVVCEDIMVPALVSKFSAPNLKTIMLGTGKRTLVEASPYDTVWGVGLGESNPRILDEKNWQGKNLLGKVLMRARDALQEVE